MMNLLAALLLAAPLHAEPCEPPTPGLEDLSWVIGLIYDVGGGGNFCPKDLEKPLDMAQVDQAAAGLDKRDIVDAAMMVDEAVRAAQTNNSQALANAAALLDALLGAAISKKADTDLILDSLLDLAENATDPLLQRQIALNLWRRGIKDKRLDALLAKYLPKSPVYSHVLPDGTTRVKAHLSTGGDGFKHSGFKEVFERAGAKVTEVVKDQELHVEYTVKPDDPTLPAVTWDITIKDDGWPPRDVLDLMGDSELNVGMYGNHSQLGTSLDKSLANAPKAAGSPDFMWVDACKSKVFASRLSQAFPEGHFVYTKNSEYFRDMPRAFQRGLVALTNHYDYEQMRRYVSSGDLYQGRNYYFPDDPGKLAYQDQDGDGISDAEDRIYDVQPKGAEPLSRAVHIGNTYNGYSGAFTGSEDMFRPDGMFDGQPGGPYTQITERKDAFGTTKYFVKVSDELLKADNTYRTATVAREEAAYWANKKGWAKDKAEAGAFLVGAAVYDVWNGQNWSSYNKESLPDTNVSQYDVGKWMDDHDFVTDSKLNEFKTWLSDQRKNSKTTTNP